MEITYELTEDDYINYNLHHHLNSPTFKTGYNIIRSFLPLSVSVSFLFLLIAIDNQRWIIWFYLSTGIFIILFILNAKSVQKSIKNQTRKILEDGDNTSVFNKKTMKIDTDTIIVKSESQTEILSRKYIKDIKVYDDMILIYTNGFTAHIIPTRYLISEIKERLLQELDVNQ